MKVATALFLLVSSSLALSIAANPANTCADPYWKDTLRCTLFPDDPPQPNAASLPLVHPGQDVPAYTRVFLGNQDVRCADGTRPVIFVDKAVCTTPGGCGPGVNQGDPVESDRWLFTVTGGDSCIGQRCGVFYAQADARVFMGSANRPAMKDMPGIHDDDPVRNPVFAGYNRVRVEKCTFDRYMGRSQEVAEGGAITVEIPDVGEVSFNVYHHGFLIWQEAFKALQNGLRYRTWTRGERRRAVNGGGAALMPTFETLPPLARAEQVLLIGHSNACHGMYHNADNLAAELQAMPGFDGDVRILFDENFLPSIENEAAFAQGQPPGSDAYTGQWSGTSTAKGEVFTYDGEQHHATHLVDQEYATHGAVHDVSCLDAHAASGTTWMCRERQHVLFNHVTTPFFVHQDFADPNRDHLDMPDGYSVRWGDLANFTYCPDAEPCTPRFSPAEFRSRLEKQLETLLAHAPTKSELSRSVDTSGPLPTMFAWFTECASHEGAYEDDSFFEATISTDATSFTMRSWLEQFMAAPRTGQRRYQVSGASSPAGLMRMAKCR